MGFPIGPCFINGGQASPFSPCLVKIPTVDSVFGSCGDHEFLRDGYLRIDREFLAVLLFLGVDGQWEGRVNAPKEDIHVPIDLVLRNCAIPIIDVVDEVTDEDVV
jgi:hypothetical protein